MKNDWVYDIETYLDIFCVTIAHVETQTRFIFEVSDRRDQSAEFIRFVRWLDDNGQRMFGFNNEGFDYVVIHHLINRGNFTALDAHREGLRIIEPRIIEIADILIRHYALSVESATSEAGKIMRLNIRDSSIPPQVIAVMDRPKGNQNRFGTMIWPNERIVTQGDLYKIHHFDNRAKNTGLKKLELNMRARRIIDLPYPPDQPTTSAQKDEIIKYMCHDVSETVRFFFASIEAIKFRDELAQRFPELGDVLNMNDTKIGKKFFEMELEKAGTPCYHRPNGRREPRQTRRDRIALRDVISPKVQFQHPEFQRVKSWLEQQVLTKQIIDDTLSETVETKGVFKNVNATIDGVTYVFGTGGIHGSIHDSVVTENDEYEIWDWDVASYYPNLGISNGFFPAHLSSTFCDVNKYLFDERNRRGKKTTDGAVLKLALNGVYGDSNNKCGPFYDPQYTMAITVNGQLLLCMLAEWLRQDGVQMIQINTDGLTVRIRKDLVEWMKQVCAYWEKHTGLELESAQYGKMIIRDVNSYIAIAPDGKVKKRIGAYAYLTPLDDKNTRERQWHQDHSMLVVRKAAEAHMVHSVSVEDFIMNHRDPFDFQLSVKVPRASRLMHGDIQVQNTSRYYVSTDGHSLTKVMPPLKDGEERPINVQSGWTVTLTNDMDHFRWENLNYYFYIQEARKLVI